MKTTTCPLIQNIKFNAQKIVNSTGALSGESGGSVSGLATIYTAGTDDAVIQSLLINSSDTSARIVQVYVNDGTNDWLIGSVSIPAGAGITSGTTAVVDFLGSSVMLGLPMDHSGKPVLPMKGGHILKAGVQVAVTSGKTISLVAIAGEY